MARIGAQKAQRFGAVLHRHEQVEQDDVDAVAVDDLDRLGAILGERNVEAGSGHARRDELAIDRIVVDAQHARGRRGPRPHVTRRHRRRVRLIERGGEERHQLGIERAVARLGAQPRQRVGFGQIVIVLDLVEAIDFRRLRPSSSRRCRQTAPG